MPDEVPADTSPDLADSGRNVDVRPEETTPDVPDDAPRPVDTLPDTPTDTTLDVLTDVTSDVTPEVTLDVTPDVTPDATPDAPVADTTEDTTGCTPVCGANEVCWQDQCYPVGAMVEVDGGSFWMGCQNPPDTECEYDELFIPDGQMVTVAGFRVDRTEVSVALFGECVTAGECDPPGTSPAACNWNKGREDHPVNCVPWSQADKYCAFAGKQLCTEAQWEKAARGPDKRVFPWGDEPADCDHAVMHDAAGDGCGAGLTAPVGSLQPAGASPCGALDMAGNVREWTADWYDDDWYESMDLSNPSGPENGTDKVVRGGSYIDPAEELRTSNRDYRKPDETFQHETVGFRCCKPL